MLQVQRVCPGNDPFLCVSFAYCYYMQTGAVCQARQSKSKSLAQQLGGICCLQHSRILASQTCRKLRCVYMCIVADDTVIGSVCILSVVPLRHESQLYNGLIRMCCVALICHTVYFMYVYFPLVALCYIRVYVQLSGLHCSTGHVEPTET